MARRKQNRGDCVFCGRELTKGGMSKHLRACPKREAAIDAAGEQTERIYHLQIQDAWSSDFWLHIEMRGKAGLQDLDRYLRAIWLECCGHLSQFSIGGWRGSEIPMERPIERVFTPGVELTHIYDFGTSSETLIKMVEGRKGSPLSEKPIYLMARNNMPAQTCAECGEPAGWLCLECLYSHNEWVTFCKKHAAKHPHEEYGDPIPLVNSPRLGMCGYDGPAKPPY